MIDISSDEDDIMITNDMEDDSLESEDPNNSGSHIDDSLNHPDEQGRVLVNIGHPPEEQDIFLVPQIAKYIKRHQVTEMINCTHMKKEGNQFIQNLFENHVFLFKQCQKEFCIQT